MFVPQLVKDLKSYSREKFMADLFAGLTVGVIALPLAMAFAIASGLPPERGLFTAIVAGFLISALGGSSVQIGGPTGAFVVLVSGIAAQYGYPGLVQCTVLAGGLIILFGIFRLGALIRYIPFPVITGFTTGIAIVIFSTQIKDLLGLNITSVSADFFPKWQAYFGALDTVNPAAAGLSCATIMVILGLRKLCPKAPAMLIAMLLATAACFYLHLDVETIGSRFGELPRALPKPSLAGFDVENWKVLLKPAFTLALLAAIESLLSATVADGMTGGRHKANIELVGQGIANIASAIFGGIPATGAIARTAANVKSGAQTPVAGMVHAVVLALILLTLAPLAKLIPLAALAGILVVVCYNMSEIPHFISLLKGPRSDTFVLILTFLTTVMVDLTMAVQLGVVMSALLFMRRMADISNVGFITNELKGDEDFREDPLSNAVLQVPDNVEVFEVNGPFFFGMIDSFRNSVKSIERRPKVLIVRIRHVPVVDATGIHVLKELFGTCKRDGTVLVFSGVQSQPRAAFKKSGLMELVGPDNFCNNIHGALERARDILRSM